MRQQLFFSGLFLGLTTYLGYFVQRTQFEAFIGAYGLFFGLYALLVFGKKWSPGDVRWYLGLGFVLRVVLLFSLPNLSDDFYRFLWDGRLMAQGINPFAHPPQYFIDHQNLPPGLTPELFARLNSPQYFTVYPPVCQVVFGLAAWLFPHSDWGAVVVMKLFLLGCEVGTIGMIARRPLVPDRLSSGCSPDVNTGPDPDVNLDSDPSPDVNLTPDPSPEREGSTLQSRSSPLPLRKGIATKTALLYALNPLILLEIMGNCHFEGAMICFLLVGLAVLRWTRWQAAAGWWALAMASKLLPPLLLPAVWRWLGWRRGGWFVLIFSGLTALFFAPLLQADVLANMGSSLRLYFRQFEFNAGVYYLVKYVGGFFTEKEIGRTVGPLLGVLTAAMVFALALWKVRRSDKWEHFPSVLCLAASIYLFNATTVHPWYVCVPLALSVGTRWRFPVLWSGLAALSYNHYAGGGFQENYGLIAVEYGAVWAFFAWEIWRGLERVTNHSLPLSPTK